MGDKNNDFRPKLMAKDNISMKLVNGAKMDRQLKKIADLKSQRKATAAVYAALSSGGTVVKKSVKSKTPVADEDTPKGFRVQTKVGQLRDSIVSESRRKAKGRDTFMHAVAFKQGDDGESDGFFSRFVVLRHKANPFGFRGGKNFVTPALRQAEGGFRGKVGSTMAKRINKILQVEIDKV